MTRRAILVALVAVLVFSWIFLYRFNTLGGSLGGLDDDHFLYFDLAKQVQAGEQPLRDFQDAMHGAWPSLTYELSAAAQRYLGDNLRSEALLTVGGVALAGAVTFIAGAIVVPWPWALLTVMLSALLAPKLYGYPKLLVPAVAALLIVGARGLPTWRRIAVMSVWTAAAFLFRHDYAVYCAVGFGALILLSGTNAWRERLWRGFGYAVLTTVLLAPSLWWIQRYSGLTEYVRNARELSRAEYERTRIGWPRFSLEGVHTPVALLATDDNAEVLVYYVFLAVPLLAAGLATRSGLGPAKAMEGGAVIALSLMTLVLWYAFLRGNLGVRLGEVGPPIAVLGAWLLSHAVAAGRSSQRQLLTTSAAAVVLIATTVCIWRLGSVAGELRTARLLEPDVFARTRQASQDLIAMPRALREAEAAEGMQAADYLHRCTRPTDRVIAVGYFPDVTAFSERLFAGGRVTFVIGYYADERYLRDTVEKLRSQSVPIVLGGELLDDRRLPLLVNYLREQYEEVGTVRLHDGKLRVLVQRGRASQPTGPHGLPCFA